MEWGERFAGQLPPDRLEVEIDHLAPEERRLRFTPRGPLASALLERALPGGDPG